MNDNVKFRELKPGEEEEWDEFVFNHPNSRIFHLYHYQNLLKTPYKCQKFIHLVAKEGDEIVGIMPNYIANRKMVSRGGILVKEGYDDLKTDFLRFVEKYIRSRNLFASFIYPDSTIPREHLQFLRIYGYEEKISKTVILSLRPSLDEIWKNLNRKNRNAIRKAKKSGVKVVKAKRREDMEDYYKLDVSAGKRKHRSFYPLSYYYDAWEILKEHYHVMDVYFAELDGKRIAGVRVNKFNKRAYYSSGHFLAEYGKYQPNNLIHWTIISDLKEEGFETYELGLVGPDSPDPQVRGIAHFKMSWGGDVLDYVTYIKYKSLLSKEIDQVMTLIPIGLRIIKRNLLEIKKKLRLPKIKWVLKGV